MQAPSLRYLVAEDDPTAAHMMRKVIRERGLGEVVAVCPTGREAERMAIECAPDVVLLDLLMPDQLGFVTLRNMRAQGYAGPVVVVSSVTEKSMVEEAYLEGAIFFIHKPLNAVEMQAVLRNVGDFLRLRQAVHVIHRTLQPLESPAAASEGIHGAGEPDRLQKVVPELLAELGILGHSSTQDLLRLAELTSQGRTFPDLRSLLEALQEASLQANPGRPPSAKTIEQRLRRAAATSLGHLAALGLEDFGDERFTRLAARFFDFKEVRLAMTQVRTGGTVSGYVNLKKLLDAFALEVQGGYRN